MEKIVAGGDSSMEEGLGRGLPALRLSKRVQSIPQAMSIYFNQLVSCMQEKGIPVKTLSLGEAFFDIPLFPFDHLDLQRGYHYSDSQGMLELRKKIAAYHAAQYGVSISPEKELLVSAGSKPLVYMALQAVLDPGDEVLIPEPAWLSYPEHVKLCDGIPRFIPYDVPPQEYGRYMTERSKVLILNNPNNPSGRRYTEAELRHLYALCRRWGIYVLSDEAYSDFVLDGCFTSLSRISPEKDGIIVVNSLSKNLGISGWRVGYVISSEKLVRAILKLNQHILTCASSILLLYLSEYFERMTEITLPQAREAAEKRQALEGYIREKGLSCLPGDAGFYLMLHLGGYSRSSMDFALHLLFKHHIAVVPGSAYGESTAHFIRMGVGVETMESLQDAVDTIQAAIQQDAYDGELVERGLRELGMERFQ